MKSENDLPEAARSRWLESVAEVELRNFQQAVTLLKILVRHFPDFPDARVLLRKAEIQMNRKPPGGDGPNASPA